MRVAAGTARKAIRHANGIVDTAVLIAVLLLVAIGCYAMWDSKQVHQAASAANYAVYKPTDEADGHSFEELRAINPEVFGWLTVYGTHIDYPVTQGPDNMKYVNTNAEGQYSLSGAIFLDSNCEQDFSGFPSILYGHHMEKNAMFGEIGLFAEKNYFDARRYGMLYYGGQEHGLEFFAFVHADAYDGAVFKANIAGKDARQAYLDMLLRTAIYTRGIQVTADDRLVLLSTCSSRSTNGRDILVGRITDTIWENTFKSDETDKGSNLSADALSLWARIPAWAKLAIALLPLALLIPLSFTIRSKRRSRGRKSSEGDRLQ